MLRTLLIWTLAMVSSLNCSSTSNSSSLQEVVEYLTKFGYIPTNRMAQELRSGTDLTNALLTMQLYGNVPQTGEIDEATLNLLTKKRCGLPDLIRNAPRNRRYVLQGQTWATTNLTWSLQGEAKNIDRHTIRKQIVKALKLWSSSSKLKFREVNSPSADIVITFPNGSHGDGYPFDGHGSILAHAFFPGDGIGGDAHFDAEEKWVVRHPQPGSDEVNFFAVAAHELGHSLGLSHSAVPNSLMFPYYQFIDENYKLPRDDIIGIQKLYGRKSKKKSSKTKLKPTRRSSKGESPTSRSSTTENYPNTNSEINQVPDSCNTTFNAISVIRNEVFIFKDKYFWRLNNHRIRHGYPAYINHFWYDLPQDLKRIDAVYQRPDSKIVFFSGKRYWLYDGNKRMPDYPRPLTDLGLPENLPKVDAAMIWGHNDKTYFFSGRQYWRFDEADGKVELDYPHPMRTWRGVPHNLDAAFQWTDGNTYFFKGKHFWKFNNRRMRVHRGWPKLITQFWFRCPAKLEKLSAESYIDFEGPPTSSSICAHYDHRLLIVMVLICFYFTNIKLSRLVIRHI